MTPAPERFTVQLAGMAGSNLQRLTAIAEQRNLQPLLVEVLRQVLEHLETNPREWGDPFVNYRAYHAVAYGKTIAAAGLRIAYAIHDSKPLVWITALRPLFGSPFAGN